MPPLTQANMEIRAANVTASEVGALLAPHPYTDPERIWDRLVSPFALEIVPSEAMQNGSFLEPAIAALAAQRLGLRLRATSKTYVHPRVRLCATPDYLVLGQPPGLVEIKLSGRPEMWPRNGPVPEHIAWQVRAQLACTGRHTAAICVLLGAGLRTYVMERDRAEEDRMLAAVDAFWRDFIVTGIRPQPAAPVLTFSFDADRAIPEKEAATA